MAKPQPETTDGTRARLLIESTLRTLAAESGGIAEIVAAIQNGLAQPIVAAIEMIRAARGRLIVTDTLQIDGPGARSLTIDGNLNDRLFEVQANTTNLTLTGMTLTNGLTNGNGGAILNNGGNLTLSFVRITDNQAGDTGGAIYDPFQADVGGNSVNFLTISNSEISVNRASKAAGIFHSGFELRIDNSTIYNNIAGDSVGGIHEQGGFATIRNSTISDNNATFVGGILSENSTIAFESTIVAINTDSSGINDINRIGSGTVGASNSSGWLSGTKASDSSCSPCLSCSRRRWPRSACSRALWIWVVSSVLRPSRERAWVMITRPVDISCRARWLAWRIWPWASITSRP